MTDPKEPMHPVDEESLDPDVDLVGEYVDDEELDA